MYRTSSWWLAVGIAIAGCDGETSGDAGTDAGDVVDDAGRTEPAVIAELDGASFELPESVALHDGAAYASLLNGAVVRITADGDVSPFGSVAIDPPGSAYALGVAV